MLALPNQRIAKDNPRLRKWLRTASDFGLAGLGLVLLVIAYGLLPNRWYQALYIYSGSMAPTLQAGDLILITPPPAELNPGMIVTIQVDGHLVTHRVIAVQADGKFVTRGDANLWADEWGEQARVRVVGLYRARIPYLGYLFGAIKNLIPVNSSGAWFIDQKQLKFQVSICSPKGTETPLPIINAVLLVTPTITLPTAASSATVTQSPSATPFETDLPTPSGSGPEPTASEPAKSTATAEPVVTEIVATPTPEPTESESPSPTAVAPENGEVTTDAPAAPEPTVEVPAEVPQP
jgi:signal peptidase I